MNQNEEINRKKLEEIKNHIVAQNGIRQLNGPEMDKNE